MPEDNRTVINRFFEQENRKLLRILRQYVIQTGLAAPHDADAVASEVLNATVVEVLEHPERFQAVDVPVAWVLGVALNLIRRRLTKETQLNRREPLLRDLYSDASMTDDELIDQFLTFTQIPERAETDETFARLLAHLSDDDVRLLRLAVLHDLSSEMIAHELGITPGAARVRLHRLLKRLRQFWGSRKRIVDYE